MSGPVFRRGHGVTPQEVRERLLDLASRPQGTTVDEVADALGVSRSRLTWQVNRAIATGALVELLACTDGDTRYFTNCTARDAWLKDSEEDLSVPTEPDPAPAPPELALTPAALTAQRTRFETHACATCRPPVMRPGAQAFRAYQRPGRY